MGHSYWKTCLIRKGVNTGMGKDFQGSCTSPAKMRDKIFAHGENVRRVRTWDDFRREVAPNDKILYDMASNIDRAYQNPSAVMTS